MLKRLSYLVFVILIVVAATVCNAAANPARPGAAAIANKPGAVAPKPVPGYITGRTTDSAGKPLANAYIRIFGLTDAGRWDSLMAKTGADGRYSIKVPPGEYRVTGGSVGVNYNGRFYQMPLELADGDGDTNYPSSAGIQRDLIWKISGLRVGYTNTNDYLSYRGIYINLARWDDSSLNALWGENSVIEITLTPNGPLIDGSQGKPLFHKMTSMHYDTWGDIPIGDYTATAQLLLNDGRRRPLRLATSTFRSTVDAPDYTLEAPVQFPPEDGQPGQAGRFGAKNLYLSFRPD